MRNGEDVCRARPDADPRLGGDRSSSLLYSSQFSSTGSTPQSAQGFVTYVTPALVIVTRTFAYGATAASNSATANEFQFGPEIGPTFRLIGGDLGQMSGLRQSLPGTSVTSMTGLDVTLRPFVRITKFSNPAGTAISGLTGGQAIFGIFN
jgi:hypothetical protein